LRVVLRAVPHTLGRAAAALAVVLVAACSGMKTYPNALEKNLQVRTETKSDSLFANVRAEVSIYRVGRDCRTDYEGTVALDAPTIAIGLPLERASLLVFRFNRSTFLGGSNSSISQETLLKPRARSRYDVDVSYRDNLYNVEIHERPEHGPRREVRLTPLGACR
jgi:hypothetical protein